MGESDRGMREDEKRHGRKQHLNPDADRSDHHALPFVREARCGRRIDIGHGHEDEKHHPDLVYLTAIDLGRIGVPEFMDGLDERIDKPEQEKVLRCQGAVDDIFGQGRPV